MGHSLPDWLHFEPAAKMVAVTGCMAFTLNGTRLLGDDMVPTVVIGSVMIGNYAPATAAPTRRPETSRREFLH